jgi:hypothetical protein
MNYVYNFLFISVGVRVSLRAVVELEGGKQGPGPCKIFDLFHFLDTKREKKE